VKKQGKEEEDLEAEWDKLMKEFDFESMREEDSYYNLQKRPSTSAKSHGTKSDATAGKSNDAHHASRVGRVDGSGVDGSSRRVDGSDRHINGSGVDGSGKRIDGSEHNERTTRRGEGDKRKDFDPRDDDEGDDEEERLRRERERVQESKKKEEDVKKYTEWMAHGQEGTVSRELLVWICVYVCVVC
jgi:hypothetical protein